jgi:glycosidase
MAKRAIIYQIYPATYGDLRFIAKKIPIIAEYIKPDYIWLSPIFKSPWYEGGYDVSDYCKIDPRFGTIKDFHHLVSVAKKHKIGILLDLVINHTSTQHEWFEKSRHSDSSYKDYYVWTKYPYNWRSLFGGSAYEYDSVRGEYYLHLYDKSQPDLNFKNTLVIKEFEKIIDYWLKEGAAGFRVDSANILDETKLKASYFPFLPGFFNYFQTKSTVKILERLMTRHNIFTISESVGGHFLSKKHAADLTRRAFDATFNVGIIDVADTFFSDKSRLRPVGYKRWFKKLADWVPEPKISLALESHDASRSVSRFFPNATSPLEQQKAAKVLAIMQFFLPSSFPCIYQGQETGTINPRLSSRIDTYSDLQSRGIYHKLISRGMSHKKAIDVVQRASRDNARQPLDWTTYDAQGSTSDSVLNTYKYLANLWRIDPVLINGDFKVQKITKSGIFDFTRSYNGQIYRIHLDFSLRTPSTVTGPELPLSISSS